MVEAATGLGMDLPTLSGWMAERVPMAGAVQGVEKFASGQSNPTYRLTCARGTYVLRTKPPGKLLKSAHMVEREYTALRALAGTAVPVPQVMALATDEESPSGRAFFVMAFLEGRIEFDPALPDCGATERSAIYGAMADTLAALHEVRVSEVGLADFGKPGSYFRRQIDRWSDQYRASVETPEADMTWIMAWLDERAPADDGQVALVHGDWRLDNLMLAPDAPRIIGVLDWELSTIGHPYADLAYQCMQWRLPNSGEMRGLAGLDRAALGIPTEEAYVERYLDARGRGPIADWQVYLVFSFFRLAAILAGVAARAAAGNASNPETARRYGKAVPILAQMARGVAGEG